jgi:hypothetical protein
MGSPRSHRGSALPVALRHSFAPAFARLHEPHPQPFVRAHKVIIGAPPFQMGEQLWGLLSRGPGTSRQRGYSMADGQIHPLDESRVQSSRETQFLQGSEDQRPVYQGASLV